MKYRDISRSKKGPFSLACTDPYIGIGWENQSSWRFESSGCTTGVRSDKAGWWAAS